MEPDNGPAIIHIFCRYLFCDIYLQISIALNGLACRSRLVWRNDSLNQPADQGEPYTFRSRLRRRDHYIPVSFGRISQEVVIVVGACEMQSILILHRENGSIGLGQSESEWTAIHWPGESYHLCPIGDILIARELVDFARPHLSCEANAGSIWKGNTVLTCRVSRAVMVSFQGRVITVPALIV